jgi:DNA-binding SARP family transcriptional activator
MQTVAPGYLIDVNPADLDVQVFEDRLRQGRAAHRDGNWAAASGELGAALTLWCGEPLPDLRAAGLLDETVARWSEQRLQALEWRIDSDLHLGRHDDVVAELSELVAAHPMREGFAGQLMLACYQSGLQLGALPVYRHPAGCSSTSLAPSPAVASRTCTSGYSPATRPCCQPRRIPRPAPPDRRERAWPRSPAWPTLVCPRRSNSRPRFGICQTGRCAEGPDGPHR